MTNPISDALRRRRHNHIDDEMAAHIEEKVADLMDEGVPEHEARLRARREFGNALLLAEKSREVWGWTSVERLAQDVRHSLRMMRRSPGFTTVAVLSLALGIGANAAIFGLLDKLAWRSLPVRAPEELRFIAVTRAPKPGSTARVGTTHSYPQFELWRDRNRSFQSLAGMSELEWRDQSANVGPWRNGQFVSGNYFDVLGVPAMIGRTLTPADDSIEGAGGPEGAAVVLSEHYWRTTYHSDPAAIGRKISVNGVWLAVVGVTPPDFFGTMVGNPPDIFVPLHLQPVVAGPESLLHDTKNSSSAWITVLGRPKPGVTDAQAIADLMPLYEEYTVSRFSPGDRSAYFNKQIPLPGTVLLEPGSRGLSYLRDRFSQPLKIMLALVAIVLLIACANIANLLLARGTARQREIAVRLAIGAGRWRIVRQLLTESAMLAWTGGAIGLLVAFWGSRVLISMLPVSLAGTGPRTLEVGPDARVLAYTFALSLVTGLLFGLVPALRATRLSVNSAIKQAPEPSGKSGRLEIVRWIVAAEIALALPLMAGAGLFIGTLRNLQGIDLGFSRQNLLQVHLNRNVGGVPRAQWKSLYEQLSERIAAVPGVQAASLVNHGLLVDARTRSGPVHFEGYQFPEGVDRHLPETYIGPDYFAAAGIPLRMGRNFTPSDGDKARQVAIVNETLARRYFAGRNPIGLHYGFDTDPNNIEIVGVVADSQYYNLRQEPVAMAYYPWRQVMPARLDTIVVRTRRDAAGVAEAMRRAVNETHPDLFLDAQTLSSQIDESLVRERIMAQLSGFFGGLALLLTCIGLYGVMAYAVTRRTQEIGIRMALGAKRADVVRMVLRESLLLAAIGLLAGVPAALALSRITESMLFRLQPNDPVVMSVAITSMLVVTILAGYLPARRAARVDPMIALRYE